MAKRRFFHVYNCQCTNKWNKNEKNIDLYENEKKAIYLYTTLNPKNVLKISNTHIGVYSLDRY